MRLENADLVVLIEDNVIAFAQYDEIAPGDTVAWVQFCAPFMPTTGMCQPSKVAVVHRVVREAARALQKDRINGLLQMKDIQVLVRSRSGEGSPEPVEAEEGEFGPELLR